MIEEVEGIEPDPGCDLRACGQRQDDAGQNQRNDRRQLQAVDRPPPVAEGISLFTGEHGRSLWRETRPLVADDGFQGVNGLVIFLPRSPHSTPSYPAHAGYPVRRSLSAQAPLSLEYWITRFRG